jgi:hypothetical protein
MATAHTHEKHITLSTDKARAGVTGHHVRYVLAYSLLGSLIAFLIIGLSYGGGSLTEGISSLLSADGLARRLVLILVPLGLLAVAAVLTLGLMTMASGARPEMSQSLMRWRVGLQFAALILVMAALFLSVG